ncbi:hypothetical protein [Aquamicrobium sp. LC103]|uniref:hypothetical protein n=1 Tax=Aquamicrobium sp. LC103 TaxID=1120658 RepID=UPI00063E7F9A|nr:hypothetical protein [Aquamicrobium sp. LC103]
MGTKEFAGQMKAEIESLKSQGVAAVLVENLINYLSLVEQSPEPNPSPAELERYKAELAQHAENVKLIHASQMEMFRSVIMLGQNAIRSMTMINGGASVALLAFLGHLASIRSEAIPTYANCLAPFVVGTLLAGLVSGGTYLSQWLYAGESKCKETAGFIANLVVILLGIASFAAFGVGALWTYDAFVSTPPFAGTAVVLPN